MASPQVWVLVPTAGRQHVSATLDKWEERGYRVAILTDRWALDRQTIWDVDLHLHVKEYPGIWRSWNMLAKAVMALGADVVVLAGDDMDPDPKYMADEIALQYLVRFPDGGGVMQPCGDPQGVAYDKTHPGGAPAAARICGSPWVGRRWVQDSYWGKGPVNADYTAFFADEELKLVAENQSKLWMRPDLIQFHRHWSWGHLPRQSYHERNQAAWQADRALFEKRKEVGFPC